jgi:hypothetical protein
MGASENVQYIPDVRAQLYNYWALKPYGKLAKSNAIADLLPRDDLETYRLAGPQSVLAEERFEALGMTGDPDLLPILNQIGERQQVHRKAVERALSWIDDPGAVTVAANMLSLPTDYPNEHIPDEGRWHSNEHSAARNVLLEGAKKRGVPPPKSLGQQDLQVWWESNRSQFPSIESIRAAFPEKRNKLLRRSPPTPAN